MKTRVFKNGNSQAVRIPKEFQFDVEELEIFQRGDEVVLRKPIRTLEEAFHLLTSLEDFMPEGRQQDPPQVREPLHFAGEGEGSRALADLLKVPSGPR